MAFGQLPGPPASHSQVRELVELVVAAGHADLRDARGALGLTQRQAGGKFTRDEAQALIDRLLAEQHEAAGDAADLPARDPDDAEPPVALRQRAAAVDRRQAERVRLLRSLPPELLAAELQRRGWVVMEP